MLPPKRRFFFWIIILLACILVPVVSFKVKHLFRLGGRTDWTGLVRGRLGQGVTFKHFSVQDSLLVLDSVTLGGALRVAQITAEKDFFSRLQKSGVETADFAFQNAGVQGFIIEKGNVSVRMISPDTFEINLSSGLPGDSNPGLLTASGRFGNCRAFPAVSTSFRADAPGLNVLFDSLVITREGQCRGSARATVSPERFRGALELPVPAKGTAELRGGFRLQDGNLDADGAIASESFEVRSVVLRSVSARFIKQGARYSIPEYSLKAFGGSGSGSAEFRDDPRAKQCDIILNLKNADLNLMPRKPQGLAFEGRFSGRMSLAGKGESWPEVLRKLRSD
jgi:hypothetical protein